MNAIFTVVFTTVQLLMFGSQSISAAIYHGGAGTTGAVMRYGVPSAVGAFGFDQLYYGRRLVMMGMGVNPRMVRQNDILSA